MSFEKDKDGNLHINVGKLGELNHNGRIYLDGSKVTGKQTLHNKEGVDYNGVDWDGSVEAINSRINRNPVIIDEDMIPVPLRCSKIVEDDIEFERLVSPPAESDVTHYAYDGRSLDKLTMKNEYKFENFTPSQKKHYFHIDSVPHGKAIELLQEFYPSLYKYHESNGDLIKLGGAFEKWIADCKWVRESHFEQIENPHDFPSVAHMYAGNDFLTMREAFEQSYFVERSHCLLYTSPSPRDMRRSRMPSSA